MIFYLGGYPAWLWGTSRVPAAKAPLFVSRRALNLSGRSTPFPKAKGPWALDSGGFKELEQHGRWTVTPEQYVREVRRAAEEIGRLQWAAVQDYMCEPPILYGGPTDPGSVAVGTGLSVEEHQLRTIESYCRLRELGGRRMAHLWAPVLQGWCLEDYVEHVHLYTTVGRVNLDEVPVIGVGSVCRRQGTEMASALLSILSEQFGLHGRLHAFGSKTLGLQLAARVGKVGKRGLGAYEDWARDRLEAGWPLQAIERAMLYAIDAGPSTWEEADAEVCQLLQSSDSFAWSFNARAHANAVRRARDEEWGPGRWTQRQDKLVVSGKSVGRVRHADAGKVHPFAPTQMLPECSRGFAANKPGRNHAGCASCRWYALAWRKRLMHELPAACRITKPPKRLRITGEPICASAERVALKRTQILAYMHQVRAGLRPPDLEYWERLKALPGAEGPLLPVQGLETVYDRMGAPQPRPMPEGMLCRAWGSGDYRWGEGFVGPQPRPAIPSPWRPEAVEAVREELAHAHAKPSQGVVTRELFPQIELFPRPRGQAELFPRKD